MNIFLQALISSVISFAIVAGYFFFKCWLEEVTKRRADAKAVRKRWADIEAEGSEPTLDSQTFELSLLPLSTLEKWATASGIKSMSIKHWMRLDKPVVVDTKAVGKISIVPDPVVKGYVHFADAKEAMLFKLAFGGEP